MTPGVLFCFVFDCLFCPGASLINNAELVSGEQEGTRPYYYTCIILSQTPHHPACHVTLSRVPCAVQEVEGPMLGDDSFVFHLLFFLLPYHGSYSLQYRVERL